MSRLRVCGPRFKAWGIEADPQYCAIMSYRTLACTPSSTIWTLSAKLPKSHILQVDPAVRDALLLQRQKVGILRHLTDDGDHLQIGY